MPGASPARTAALACVSERRRRDARMRELLRSSRALGELSSEDKALASRLALGTTSAESVLDEAIDRFARKPSRLEPRVRDALRVSAFEILYLGTPGAVAVSQGVELVRSVAPRAAGMANAVLRRLADEMAPEVARARAACAECASRKASPSARDLSLAGGFPEKLAELLLSSCGEGPAAELALAQLDPGPVWVATLPFACDALDVPKALEEQGLMPRPERLEGSYGIGAPSALSSSSLVGEAKLAIADLAAQLVALVAAPRPGERLLEIGQGRATKTLLMEAASWRMGGLCEVVAIDNVASKAKLARARLAEAGLSDWTSSHVWDAAALDAPESPLGPTDAFDVVFVDAPCSGTGTMRRHPEIPARLGDDPSAQVAELAALQLRMLAQASAHVGEGEALVYSTCSVLREECEEIVERFLASETGSSFEVEPVDVAPAASLASSLISESMTGEGFLRTWPSSASWDGHFCARLRKR